jgi:hypothetical protein
MHQRLLYFDGTPDRKGSIAVGDTPNGIVD